MFKIMAFSFNTCTQPCTPLINGFVDHTWIRLRNGDTSSTPLRDIAR